VVVVKQDSTSRTLPRSFAVQAGGGPDLWVEVGGRLFARHVPSRLTIFYGNRGNVDALAVPLVISNSSQYGLSALFDIEQAPSQPDQRLTNFSQVPVTAQAGSSGGYTNTPLLLPVIPAGFTGMLQILLKPPAVPPGPSTFFVNFDTPYFNPTLDPRIVGQIVAGAVAYSPIGFATVIPSTLIPGLEQYVTNQLNLVVDQGRKAFISSLGTSAQVFSYTQLQIDAAIVGAVRALQP